MVCMTDILSHSHAPNIVLSLPDDRDLHCSDCGWRNVLFCHLTVEFFLFRVSTQALIPLGTQVDQTKYRSMIEGLMYLTASRPDLAFATFVCARYQAHPTEKHLKEVKRIFRYLRQTINMGLWYSKDSGFELIAYSDVDLAECNNDCKSTSGGIQFLGDKLVSWSSKKQDCTAMSTAEAEYVSLSACSAQVIWMMTQLLDYGFWYNKIPIYCDSQSAIAISCNPVQHSRTKHINIRYHFIKEHVEKGTIEFTFIPHAQQAQLVSRFHTIERCNNYAVLQSIPCSPECKIVGQILLDHPLSYALTATAGVPVVVGYQGVVDKTKKNILQLFHTVINQTNVDYAALLWWDIMNNVRQMKEAIQYPRFIKLILADLMKKFPKIPQRIEEDYHSIKDDILLVSVYTTRNVHIRGMLIPDTFLTEEIRATNDFKEYETVQSHKITIKRKKPCTTPILPPNDDRERDEIAEATLLSLTLHKTALAAEAQENIAKVQEKLAEDEIEKMVECEEDEESYASEFADSVLNDEVDDSDNRLEPRSHKENPEKVDDDDDVEIEKKKKDDIEIEKEKKDGEIEKEKNNDNVEETDKVVKKDIFDDVTGNMQIRKEKKQTPIPLPTRSLRNVSSSDKTVSEELTATVSPTTATTSKYSSTTKRKKRSFSHKTKTLLGSIAGMCRRHGLIRSHIKNKFVSHNFFMSKIREVLDHCNKVVPDTTFAKPKEMITQEMPRLVNLAVDKDREVDPINAQEVIANEFATHGPKMIKELFRKHMQNTTLNLYPTISTSTAEKSSADLQHQLHLNMKSKPQDQAAIQKYGKF
ncbi:hypothetical protein Tco_0000373 [Tanacetum coccineum]